MVSSLPEPLTWTLSCQQRAGWTLRCCRGSAPFASAFPASSISCTQPDMEEARWAHCLQPFRELTELWLAWKQGCSVAQRRTSCSPLSATVHHGCESLAQPREGSRAIFSHWCSPSTSSCPGESFLARGEVGPFGCGDVIHPLCPDEDETHQGTMWCRCDKFHQLFRTGVIRCSGILLPASVSYKSLVKQEEN